jgi:hypothetical protein
MFIFLCLLIVKVNMINLVSRGDFENFPGIVTPCSLVYLQILLFGMNWYGAVITQKHLG